MDDYDQNMKDFQTAIELLKNVMSGLPMECMDERERLREIVKELSEM
jgi:hypothetical protein